MADDPTQWSEERKRVASFGRLDDGLVDASPWYRWGPYLSERAWGTVREDYSGDECDAWDYFPHDMARSRAYRWSEDGLAGFSDVEQRLCLALALWNGNDPILKERLYGVTGPEGNHGEDVKEYWWFVDSVPSHVWNQWRYHYPQDEFPYDQLARGHDDDQSKSELELLDTGVFDGNRYWVVEVDYAKDDPDDVLMRVRVTNAGPEPARLHVLPTLWFRNTWSWDDSTAPTLAGTGSRAVAVEHPTLGRLEWLAGRGPDGRDPEALFCDNETNAPKCFKGASAAADFPKDSINDYVTSSRKTGRVNPKRVGTKAAFWYVVDVEGGGTVELRLRLRPADGPNTGDPDAAVGESFGEVMDRRRAEADAFYEELTPRQTTPEDASILRQAVAGMLWCKQLYHYDVDRWLEGDPAFPPPPESRKTGPKARNVGWRHLRAFDIMSMPDSWEYPWFAAWDMAFHCLALAHVDPAFAKYQLSLLCGDRFRRSDGAVPAYEWNFDDVNPPVQAWGALQVFHIDGDRDVAFLARIYSELRANFTWWIERLDADGNNLFEGGFLGLDNIGPIDRSHFKDVFPAGSTLEQSDASGWMAFYSLQMLHIATTLALRGALPSEGGDDPVVTFLEHFHAIAIALNRTGVWDEADGFYYDLLRLPDQQVEMRVRSMVGLIPLLAAAVVDERAVEQAAALDHAFQRMEDSGHIDVEQLRRLGYLVGEPGSRRLLLSVASPEKLRRLFEPMFDDAAFLSPFGLRSLSKEHRADPFTLQVGDTQYSVGYEPAESTSRMFGGNSNWRGPVWFPLNHLVISALERYHSFFGDQFTVEYPSGSAVSRTLSQIADDLRERLISLFRVGPDGRRPAYGFVDKLQHDPRWNQHAMFFEYFHGDNGAGLGASHQTGWTGLVVDMMLRRPDRDELDTPIGIVAGERPEQGTPPFG